MAEFRYQPMFEHGADETEYRQRLRMIYDFNPDDGFELDACFAGDVNMDGMISQQDELDMIGLAFGIDTSRPPLPGPWATSGDFDDGLGLWHGDYNDDGVLNVHDYCAWRDLVIDGGCGTTSPAAFCP